MTNWLIQCDLFQANLTIAKYQQEILVDFILQLHNDAGREVGYFRQDGDTAHYYDYNSNVAGIFINQVIYLVQTARIS